MPSIKTSSVKKLPDFLVVGTAKSGTTSVSNFLSNQKKIFIPKIKECRFFSNMPTNFKGGEKEFQNGGVRKEKEYIDLFSAQSNKISGDISNDYFFYYDKSIKKIKKIYKRHGQKEPKIIIIIRNPFERIISLYLHHKRINKISLNFNEFLKNDEYFTNENYAWTYKLIQNGLISKNIKAYKNNFKNVGIFLFDDIKNENFWSNISKFINLKNPNFISTKANRNIYSDRKSTFILYMILRKLYQKFLKGYVREDHKEGFKEKLISFLNKNTKPKFYFDNNIKKIINKDIKEVEKIIGKNLRAWILK